MKMKKTLMAAAVLMVMGAGAAQAAVTNFSFSGGFVMFDGSDPTFTNPAAVVDNGNVFDVGGCTATQECYDGTPHHFVGDPVVGTMQMDFGTGAGSATMTGSPFFGSNWYARNISMQAGMSGVVTTMLFDWGSAVGASTNWSLPGATAGDGTGTCGVTNCDIGVTVTFSMTPIDATHYQVTTISSSMPSGPFAGFQPTFGGVATVVPVPAAVWLLGSGLLGLVGVARRKAA